MTNTKHILKGRQCDAWMLVGVERAPNVALEHSSLTDNKMGKEHCIIYVAKTVGANFAGHSTGAWAAVESA